MLKDFLRNLLQMRGVFKPLVWSQINSLGDDLWLNNSKREVPVVLSLFSERENFENLPITLYSLFDQQLKPDRIVLYLDKEYEDLASLPYEITQFVKNGLEIRFVQNIKRYSKTIYALKDFPNSIIVTLNDQVYYPTSWLRKIYMSYVSRPECIQAFNAQTIVKENFTLKIFNDNRNQNKFSNLPIDTLGVLYPPNCFTNEVFRKDIYLKKFNDADELWFWTMALLNNRKINIVKKGFNYIVFVDYLKHIFKKNNFKNENYREVLDNIVKSYGNYILRKL